MKSDKALTGPRVILAAGIVFALVLAAVRAIAQTVDPGIPPDATDAIADFVSKLGWFSYVLMVVGAFRILNKPIFSAAHWVTSLTATKADDEVVDKIERSKILNGILYVIDWLLSIKVKPPVK